MVFSECKLDTNIVWVIHWGNRYEMIKLMRVHKVTTVLMGEKGFRGPDNRLIVSV